MKDLVFDTWAKFQSSVLVGNRQNPGGFTDCVNFRHESNSTALGTFQGQHCMVDFSAAVEELEDEVVRGPGFDWKAM